MIYNNKPEASVLVTLIATHVFDYGHCILETGVEFDVTVNSWHAFIALVAVRSESS